MVKQRGFTLMEAIIVMVITGIIASMVAVFITAPVKGYVDTVNRAALVDIADTAMRRISRDIRIAVPNSVYVDAANNYLTLLPSTTGGRYRTAGAATTLCGSNTDLLDFTAADTCFEIFGPPITFTTGDQIVINNSGDFSGDAYTGNSAATDVRRTYAGATGSPVSKVVMTSTAILPSDSTSHRFYVMAGADLGVTYSCEAAAAGEAGPKVLRRYWGCSNIGGSISKTIPATCTANALLADYVSNCAFKYGGSTTLHKNLYELVLQLTKNGESVSLYHEIQVSNLP